jgi:sugar (pentulose or hexulose) kinase
MSDLLLGIDFGTGGAKACLIDTTGRVLASAFEEYPIIHERPGWSEHDPDLYWGATRRLTGQVLSHAHAQPELIKGIAVSSALPSLVMVDANHCPIHRAYNLMDRRATTEVAWLKENIGEDRILRLTANRIEDHPTIVNLMWERAHRSDAYERIYKALTIDGFIVLKLTGEAVLNFCAATLYGVAYDPVARRFDEQMLQEVGVDPSLLPRLLDCEEIAGEVTREAARETGLAPGTPVAAGQIDFNASCIAAGITDEGDIMSNLGSVGNFGIIHRDRDYLRSKVGLSMLNFAFTIDSENTFTTAASTTTGGQSIRFLRDFFSQVETEVERTLGIGSYDLLNLEAQEIALGSEGLVILPYLMGERTPIWDEHARGVVFGLSLNHSKGHIIRAMMEAVAYALYDSYRLIADCGLRINYPIVFHEGGAVSKLWRQIITDVFNTPTVLVGRRAGAPWGDALLAGVATGIVPDYALAKECVELVDPMEPDPQNHERYMQFFHIYKQLYEHLQEDFLQLAAVRDLSAR